MNLPRYAPWKLLFPREENIKTLTGNPFTVRRVTDRGIEVEIPVTKKKGKPVQETSEVFDLKPTSK
jgi:hypothetical protein